MTLKQFAELCVGCIAALITYATNLPDVIKWPLIILFVCLGAMVAFVPFEERPLDHWVTTFISVLYRPTQFFWKKQAKMPDSFSFESKSLDRSDLVQDVDLSPARRERVKEYLQSIDLEEESDIFSQYQDQRYKEVMLALHTGLDSHNPSSSLPGENLVNISLGDPSAATENRVNNESFASLQQEITTEISIPSHKFASADSLPTSQVIPDSSGVEDRQGEVESYNHNLSQNRGPVEVPELEMVRVESQAEQEVTEYSRDATLSTDQSYVTDQAINQEVVFDPNLVVPVQLASSIPDIPSPAPPAIPNQLAGVVTDQQGNLQEGAIVEVITPTGMSARAVKTNPLGQFYVTTPLGNGSYILRTEKTGLQFQLQSLELGGELVPPLIIWSV